jgi:aminomethyltransferase
VFVDDESVGEVTRATVSPTLDVAVGFAVVDYDVDARDLAVELDAGGEDGRAAATRVDLPFVEGSARSARLPSYPDRE